MSEIRWKADVAESGGKRDSRLMLRPYWIKTDNPLDFGYGITAWSEEDAEALLHQTISSDCAIISIKWLEDAASLDQGHVIPNMGNMLRRGIWYPLGHQHLTK